jgi:hypothetical protein
LVSSVGFCFHVVLTLRLLPFSAFRSFSVFFFFYFCFQAFLQMSACVQCGGKYLDDDSCAFHLSNDSNRSGQYNCCGKSTGCVLNKPHSLVHHCKFPYAKFLPYARGITGYTDTTDEFAEVKLTNLEDNTSEFASVSQLLRYVSKGKDRERTKSVSF